MERKKCIIFARVSSERQSYDEQTIRLSIIAEKDGYPISQQIRVEYKESGVLLTEEERLGLTDMKRIITDDPSVDCVYAFEISRIARTKKVLFSIEEFLITRKIQLVIIEPYIHLLADDGSVSDSAEFAFTLFAQMAESEIRVRKARFANGRSRAKRLGNWHGGHVTMGFKVVDKKLVADEDKSFIIVRMFELYAAGTSPHYISEHLRQFGVHRKGNNLMRSLHNPIYKKIVGEELWNKCQEMAKEKTVEKKYRLYSPGERLMTCSCCGRHYIRIGEEYMCIGRKKEYGKDCAEGFCIRAQRADAVIIFIALMCFKGRLERDREAEVARLTERITEIPDSLVQTEKDRRKVTLKRERVLSMYADGIMERKSLDSRLKDIDNELRKIERTSEELSAELAIARETVKQLQESGSVSEAGRDIFVNGRSEETYRLIHREIREIRMSRSGKYKLMDVVTHTGYEEHFRFHGRGLRFRTEWLVIGQWVDFDPGRVQMIEQVVEKNRERLATPPA